MSGESLILAIVIVAGVTAVIFFLNKKLSSMQAGDKGKEIVMLQQQIGQMAQTLDRKLSETNKLTREQLLESSQFMGGVNRESREMLQKISQQSQGMIKDVTEQLTKLDETNRRVVDFSSQLKNLQDILKNPKQRGVLGEYYLEETLKNVLPPDNYKMQYGFKDGTIVDAVIFVKDKIIPVDSKFSLETYEQLLNCNDSGQREALSRQFKNDLKQRIDETSKYVKPAEKTVDFAFMFIPSESIYYDLLTGNIGSVNSRNLIVYAFKEKHVIIVSPTSFLAYLQTVLQGLRALRIEESAKTIQKNVEKLGKHLQTFEAYHQKLGTSLSTTVNHFNRSRQELGKVDKDVMKITEGKVRIDAKETEIERPQLEE